MAAHYKDGDRWPGGRIHIQKDGRPLFIIERRVRGRRFHVSTRAHTWPAAMKQLERFESNPDEYRPEGGSGELLLLTDKLILEYGDYLVDVKRTTAKHAREMCSRLADWAEDLEGRDLRRLSLRDDVKAALDSRKVGRAHRIIAIKSLMAWLRKERHLVTSGQDVTLDLPVPQAVPEKWKRRKAVPFRDVQSVMKHLAPVYRDVLHVLASTGFHVTELERLIRNPESEIVYKRGRIRAVLRARHKIGEPTTTPIKDPAALAAAERLRERGEMPRKINDALKAACRAAHVPEFTAGVMRHSVATWLIERGEIPALVSQFLHHKDPRTTKRFYADVSVPSADVTVPRLRVVEGSGRTGSEKKRRR